MAVNNNRQQGSTSLRDAMSELMNDSVIRQATPRERGAGLLLADVIETPEQFVIRVDVPGLNPDDINVSMFQGTVTITCPARSENVEGQYVVRERNHSPLTRQFAFGQTVGGDVAANCENGVLTLRLPKSEVIKPKEIKITPR
ncbi:MAG TPA: Hsp20/alpha crystallin family protein [Chloroflexota bacterium]|nr:Hsp20/alpha crystallin family protein [Chloroflexota bacterium]